nr:replication protein A 70 kDa DNA-binding subunit B-like [Ipomoea batatas]
MIKFKHDTAVKEYKRMKFPKIMFRFKSFEYVIGRIVEVYSPMEKVIGGKQTRLMDFVLEDVSKRQIHCTLWDEHVDQLIPYYNSTVVDPVILIIQLCRAKFMDNGEVHICSSFDATQLFFTHTSKEFVNFKNRPGVHVIPNEIAALRGMSMLFQIVMKKEQVDNYYSAFTVLRICRDEVVLTQHCSGLFDRNEGDLVAANGGDWLDFEDNSEDGVVSDDDGSRGLDAMYKEMEKDKIVDLGDSDGASSSEQATLPLKRCLIDEFDCVGGTSIIDDFDCVGGTSKKAKEIVVKLEKM